MKEIPSVLRDTDSKLCIGIDPRVKHEQRLRYAKELVKETSAFALAYKPNIQFWHGSAKEEILELTEYIHSFGHPIIADLKISDIGSTNRQALESMSDLGFDYVTHSPFPGNTSETAELASEIGVGIITLVAMSNPEAKWMVDTGQYLKWAKEAEQFSDGIVIGTTNHITTKIIKHISEIVESKFVLAPGIGVQDGSIIKLERFFPRRVIYNVSRGIGLSDNFKTAAEKYYRLIHQ